MHDRAVLGELNVAMAGQRDVLRVTGYPVGAVSAPGYRREDVDSYLDRAVLDLGRAIISSGRPDMGLELDPQDLLRALEAQVDDFSC
jgi:prolyl-tRNA editing enzyme YbaK/EbsC (Cys-tRNA(Pro) deacylase)